MDLNPNGRWCFLRERMGKKIEDEGQPAEASRILEIGSCITTIHPVTPSPRCENQTPDEKRQHDDFPTLLQSQLDISRLFPIPKGEILL